MTSTKPTSSTPPSTALTPQQIAANTLASQQGAYATLVQIMQQMTGLSGGQLDTLLAGAWGDVQAGLDSSTIMAKIESSTAWDNLFPGLAQRNKSGLTPITPAEYLSTKNSYVQTLVSAGIDPRTVDLSGLIVKDVSPAELSDRITQGYQAVAMAPQDVVSAFHNYYGVTRAQLAQYFLDPKANEESLLRKAMAAEIGGAAAGSGFMGATQGSGQFPVNQQVANQLAAQGVTYNQAQAGFAQLATQAQLYNRLPGQAPVRGYSTPQLAEAQFFGGPAEQQLQLEAARQKGYFQAGTQVGTTGTQTALGAYQR